MSSEIYTVNLKPPVSENYGWDYLDNLPNQLSREFFIYALLRGNYGKMLQNKHGIDISKYRFGTVFQHLINLVRMVYPNEIDLEVKGYRNTNTLRIFEALAYNDDLGIAGNAGSGKTHPISAWIVLDWMSAPSCTSVMVASTSIGASAQRIWGSVIKHFRVAQKNMQMNWGGTIGELVDYKNLIVFGGFDPKDTEREYINSITAIAYEDGEEGQKALTRTRGVHNTRVRLIVDELADMRKLPEVNDVRYNLLQNVDFVYVGIGNPDSRSNPHKDLCEPKDPRGWSSVNKEMDEWETHTGKCIFLSGERSPNFQAPEDEYPPFPYLLTRDRLKIYLNLCRGNTNALNYWRNVIGFWPGTEVELTVLSRSFIASCKIDYEPRWRSGEIRPICGLDVGFTQGGDKCCASFGKLGTDDSGRKMGHYIGTKEYQALVGEPFEQSIARQVVKDCVDAGVAPSDLGMDVSGDGGKMLQALIIEWLKYDVRGVNIYPISSMGRPSENRVSAQDGRKCIEVYDRKVTEMWFNVRNAVGCGVLVGLDLEQHRDVVDDLCSREFFSGNKTAIETKAEMKKRIRRSPDCFVHGTLVNTINGKIRIENLKIGDLVSTPFGYSPIIDIQKSMVSEVTETKFSNGASLTGKGKHKVFTFDKGWVRLDSLSFTNEIESDINLPLWNILNLFFTKDASFAFKPLVDTIKTKTDALRRRDFYIEGFGTTTMVLFLKTWQFIIKTMIGRITGSKIWNLWKEGSIRDTTCESISKTQNFVSATKSIFRRLLRLPQSGTLLLKDWLGIPKMEKTHGRTERPTSSNAFNAKKISKPTFPIKQNSATGRAIKITNGIPTSPIKEIARLVVRNFWLIVTGGKSIAPVSVEQLQPPEKREVLNLTLQDHNVYYANGILVQNCGDSFVYLNLMFQRAGMELVNSERDPTAEEIEAFERKWLYNPERAEEPQVEEFSYSSNSDPDFG